MNENIKRLNDICVEINKLKNVIINSISTSENIIAINANKQNAADLIKDLSVMRVYVDKSNSLNQDSFFVIDNSLDENIKHLINEIIHLQKNQIEILRILNEKLK